MSSDDIERRSVEEVDDDLAEQWETMIEEADRELGEVETHLRWQQPDIEVIKRAAARCGISYQTYIRRAAFRQALTDLKATENPTPTPPLVGEG